MKPGSFLLLTLLLFFLYSDIAAKKIDTKEYCNDYLIDNCLPVFEPVCGIDDKTYINRCTFCIAYLKSRRKLRLRNVGLCKFEDVED